MLEELKAFLIEHGFEKEAAELESLAQLSTEDMSLDYTLDGIKRTLNERVDAKIEELRALGHSRPEDFMGSKEAWLMLQLDQSPVTIIYPNVMSK